MVQCQQQVSRLKTPDVPLIVRNPRHFPHYPEGLDNKISAPSIALVRLISLTLSVQRTRLFLPITVRGKSRTIQYI